MAGVRDGFGDACRVGRLQETRSRRSRNLSGVAGWFGRLKERCMFRKAFDIADATYAPAQDLSGGSRGFTQPQTPAGARASQGKKLRDLLARKGVVLCVLGAPTASAAQWMDEAGVEAAVIGTSIV